MTDDLERDLQLVRDALGQALSDDDDAVMVTSFVAAAKVIEPDGRSAFVTISGCDLAGDALGMFTFGVEESKARLFGGNDGEGER